MLYNNFDTILNINAMDSFSFKSCHILLKFNFFVIIWLVHFSRDPPECAEDIATHLLHVHCNDIGDYICHASLDSSEDYGLDERKRSVYLNFTGKESDFIL
jgi:hypothetical protein